MNHEECLDRLRLAAIDIGSNSIRLVVAEPLPTGGYRVLDEERESTRLYASLTSTGRIQADAIEDSMDAIGRFSAIARGYDTSDIRVVATSAVREAKNGDAFCQRVHDELGLDVEVITAAEEATLAFESVRGGFETADRKIAVVDIGGGSTEIVLAAGGHIEAIYATHLGAVRTTEKWGAAGRLSEDRRSYMERKIDRHLEKRLGKPAFVPEVLCGTGGTFTTLASIVMASKGISEQPISGYRITRGELRQVIEQLALTTLEKRRKTRGLSTRRADVIVAALIVIDRIMRHLKVNVIQAHSRGIRDGLLLRVIHQKYGQHFAATQPQATVEEFAISCGVDMRHAEHVANVSRSLFHQLAEPLGLDHSDEQILRAAAILQNVGHLVNFAGHHKHGYHLIVNSGLPGFTHQELLLIANVVRYHRGAHPKLRHDNFRRLDDSEQLRVRQLASILRIATALNRSPNRPVEEVDIVLSKDCVTVIVNDDDAELGIWAARRKADLFEDTFARQLLLARHGTSSDPRDTCTAESTTTKGTRCG